ncbi:MAG: DUF502 domain-containing protein [Planctomycetota bacterium]
MTAADQRAPKQRRPKKGRRGFFIRGLAVVLPTVLTVFILVSTLQFADRYVAGPINRVIYTALDGNAAGWRVLRSVGIDPYEPRFLLEEQQQPEHIQELYRKFDVQLGPESELADYQDFLTALSKKRDEKAAYLRDHRALGIDHEKLRGAVELKVGIWAGILLAAGIVLTVGYLASDFLGRSAIATFDRLLVRVPVVRAVYPHAKQLVGFFLSEKRPEFETVVAVPYPSEGLWSLAFMTSTGLVTLNETLGGEYVAVYIPSSPLPMTGYTIFVEASRLIHVPITVEEAFRTVVSAGVLIPPSQTVSGLTETLQRLGMPTDRDRASDAQDHSGEQPA